MMCILNQAMTVIPGGIVISTVVTFIRAHGTSCEAFCDDVPECRNDPQAQGSYCKSWQNPEVCFGLYWTDERHTDMCFFPNDYTCPQNIPVECPVATDKCIELCDSTPGCTLDPHQPGSYCKSWQNPPVCFGLYYTDLNRTSTCFEPSENGACSDEFPVFCDDTD